VSAVDRQPSPFGVLAKRIRESRGYAVADVTSRGHLSSGYLTMIEKGDRGKQIGRDKVIQIATGLRATDDERDELLRVAGFPPATDLPPSRIHGSGPSSNACCSGPIRRSRRS
jgi:transcriptional regulator with XRE-family HTH domain